MNSLKIAIGSDHAGFDYKEAIADWLADADLKDFGTYSADSVDYPDFAHPVASAVESGDFEGQATNEGSKREPGGQRQVAALDR